jgi:hypothetical protein
MMKILIFKLFIFMILTLESKSVDIIIDSDMTFAAAIEGTKAPKELIDSLCLLEVEYYSFDNKLHKGQLVVNIAVKEDLTEAFKIAKKIKFPIHKMIPIVKLKWDDDESMKQNNSSAFNYRFIAGTTRLSNHSFGRAVDINPRQNPVIYSDGRISPVGARYDIGESGTFSKDNEFVIFLKSKGWRWGGEWTSLKDNHHFDKP